MGVLRFVFNRGMGNRVGIGPRFVRGMDFWVGIRFIRPPVWPSVGRIAYAPQTGDLKNGDFSIHSTTAVAVCGAYSIRPYPDGRNSIHFFAHSASGVAVCGAYSIRPYTGDLKNGDFSIRSTTGVAVCGAYAVAPLHGQTKTGLVFGSYFEEGRKRGRDVGCAKSGVGALP